MRGSDFQQRIDAIDRLIRLAEQRDRLEYVAVIGWAMAIRLVIFCWLGA